MPIPSIKLIDNKVSDGTLTEHHPTVHEPKPPIQAHPGSFTGPLHSSHGYVNFGGATDTTETATIPNNATETSLVILDEIGRGTSTFDGMALAWAVAERIVQMKTRALFATHFHQLTDMANIYHGVKNVHTLARETGDTIIFLHKVVDGGTDRSYGVHVAALAGVPEQVVNRAKEMLTKLENQNSVTIDGSDGTTTEKLQTSLEALTIDDPIVEQIKHMDLERTTPMDALLRLKELQDEAKKRK